MGCRWKRNHVGPATASGDGFSSGATGRRNRRPVRLERLNVRHRSRRTATCGTPLKVNQSPPVGWTAIKFCAVGSPPSRAKSRHRNNNEFPHELRPKSSPNCRFSVPGLTPGPAGSWPGNGGLMEENSHVRSALADDGRVPILNSTSSCVHTSGWSRGSIRRTPPPARHGRGS